MLCGMLGGTEMLNGTRHARCHPDVKWRWGRGARVLVRVWRPHGHSVRADCSQRWGVGVLILFETGTAEGGGRRERG